VFQLILNEVEVILICNRCIFFEVSVPLNEWNKDLMGVILFNSWFNLCSDCWILIFDECWSGDEDMRKYTQIKYEWNNFECFLFNN